MCRFFKIIGEQGGGQIAPNFINLRINVKHFPQKGNFLKTRGLCSPLPQNDDSGISICVTVSRDVIGRGEGEGENMPPLIF